MIAKAESASQKAPADGPGPEDPTPEQIWFACLRIRAGWSAAKRASQWRGPRAIPWRVPTVSISGEIDGEEISRILSEADLADP